jgi:hypothetical protein
MPDILMSEECERSLELTVSQSMSCCAGALYRILQRSKDDQDRECEGFHIVGLLFTEINLRGT